jgi:hypothetical protein
VRLRRGRRQGAREPAANAQSTVSTTRSMAHTARCNVVMLDHDTKALIDAAARMRH